MRLKAWFGEGQSSNFFAPLLQSHYAFEDLCHKTFHLLSVLQLFIFRTNSLFFFPTLSIWQNRIHSVQILPREVFKVLLQCSKFQTFMKWSNYINVIGKKIKGLIYNEWKRKFQWNNLRVFNVNKLNISLKLLYIMQLANKTNGLEM